MQFSEERKWQKNEVTNWKLKLFEYLRSSLFFPGVLSALMHAIYVVKERFLNAWDQLGKIFTLFGRRYGHPLIIAV